MKCLHFDCFAGISGDMTLGALVDLGVPPGKLTAELGKLNVRGWRLRFAREESNGIAGTRAIVEIEDEDELEHGEHGHHHEHGGYGCGHEQHGHECGGHDSRRRWSDIKRLIEDSELSGGAKRTALKIFTRIAEAEAEVHNVKVEDVEFHEVGALDSIIDITGTAVCLDILKPERITAGEIELGGGTVKCVHGVLPVPAPATLLLCRGLPVKTGGFPAEMTTPTGAAILAACVDEFVTQAVFTEIKTGCGIGSRKFDRPDILRVSLRECAPGVRGQPAQTNQTGQYIEEELVMLESNIDDMTGEGLGFLAGALFESGALDVTVTPCVMKKGRPANTVSVLCTKETSGPLTESFFLKSSTAGIRVVPVRRISLRREITENVIDGTTVKTKTVFFNGKPLRSKTEYEDRARIAKSKNRALDTGI